MEMVGADVASYSGAMSATDAALGNGDGTFQPGFPTGLLYPFKLLAADVNNDGCTDIIGTGTNPTQVALGSKNGTFSIYYPVDTNDVWDSSNVADMNSDGNVDIVEISASRHQIATLFGTGEGTFSAPIVTTLNSAMPTSVSLGDVNGDGVPDALVTYQNVGAYILTGHGDGTFSSGGTQLLADPDARVGRLADFNGDGTRDAAVCDTLGCHVLLGNGNGSFGVDHPCPGTSPALGQINCVDINGDGFADLIEPTYFGETVYLGSSDGTFSTSFINSSVFASYAAVLADFNGDGRPDLFTASFDGYGDAALLAHSGSVTTAPSIVGSVPQSSVINPASAAVTLTQDVDGQHIDWVSGSQVGQVAITAAAGLSINGGPGMTTIQLNHVGGNPFPSGLHLNGTFTLNGFTGDNPLAGVTLDINASTLLITYAYHTADPLGIIRVDLHNGYNAGAWNGTPTATTGVIASAAAAANANQTTGIGYVDSADGSGINTVPNSIELKYTLYSDFNLTGTVGFPDLGKLAQNYGTNSGGTWDTGDWNYDGSVGFGDLALLARTYGKNIASPGAAPDVQLDNQAANLTIAAVGAGPAAPAPLPGDDASRVGMVAVSAAGDGSAKPKHGRKSASHLKHDR